MMTEGYWEMESCTNEIYCMLEKLSSLCNRVLEQKPPYRMDVDLSPDFLQNMRDWLESMSWTLEKCPEKLYLLNKRIAEEEAFNTNAPAAVWDRYNAIRDETSESFFLFCREQESFSKLQHRFCRAYDELIVDYGVLQEEKEIALCQNQLFEDLPRIKEICMRTEQCMWRVKEYTHIMMDMSCVYAAPEMMGSNRFNEHTQKNYPLNYESEHGTDLAEENIMKEIYGSPEMFKMLDSEKTIQLCWNCGRAIPASAVICQYCGKGQLRD